MKKPNLGFEAFEGMKRDGIKYKKIKTFKNKNKAKEFVETLEAKSRRHLPIIQEVAIGLKLGYVYRVWVPQ
jgi:hypothetical protein